MTRVTRLLQPGADLPSDAYYCILGAPNRCGRGHSYGGLLPPASMHDKLKMAALPGLLVVMVAGREPALTQLAPCVQREDPHRPARL